MAAITLDNYPCTQNGESTDQALLKIENDITNLKNQFSSVRKRLEFSNIPINTPTPIQKTTTTPLVDNHNSLNLTSLGDIINDGLTQLRQKLKSLEQQECIETHSNVILKQPLFYSNYKTHTPNPHVQNMLHNTVQRSNNLFSVNKKRYEAKNKIEKINKLNSKKKKKNKIENEINDSIASSNWFLDTHLLNNSNHESDKKDDVLRFDKSVQVNMPVVCQRCKKEMEDVSNQKKCNDKMVILKPKWTDSFQASEFDEKDDEETMVSYNGESLLEEERKKFILDLKSLGINQNTHWESKINDRMKEYEKRKTIREKQNLDVAEKKMIQLQNKVKWYEKKLKKVDGRCSV